jgi:hypothetical protein
MDYYKKEHDKLLEAYSAEERCKWLGASSSLWRKRAHISFHHCQTARGAFALAHLCHGLHARAFIGIDTSKHPFNLLLHTPKNVRFCQNFLPRLAAEFSKKSVTI